VSWWARWVKGRNGKGEELPRVFSMVKTAPLGIALEGRLKTLILGALS